MHILMHKQKKVAEIELDVNIGFIKRIGKVFAPEHFPIGVPVQRGIADRAALNEWWLDRSIPASRSGVSGALEALSVSSTKTLLAWCYGLSLSDQYWILPEEMDLPWEKHNFFGNGFSDDVGDALFGVEKFASFTVLNQEAAHGALPLRTAITMFDSSMCGRKSSICGSIKQGT